LGVEVVEVVRENKDEVVVLVMTLRGVEDSENGAGTLTELDVLLVLLAEEVVVEGWWW